jgi:hypothetical protein
MTFDMTSARNFLAISLASTDWTIPTDANGNPTFTPKGLYVGGAGDVKMDGLQGGTGVTFSAMGAGITHPECPSKIYKTGTTATGLVIVY